MAKHSARRARRIPDGRFVTLEYATWSPVTSAVVDQFTAFAFRGLVHAGQSLQSIAIKGFRANPHFTLFGEAFLLREVLLRQFETRCRKPADPTVAEVRAILAAVPELKRAYRLSVRGAAWELTLKYPRRPLRGKDWAMRDWKLLFDLGERRAFFDLRGVALEEFLQIFAWLNGDRTAGEIRRRFHSQAKTVERFFAFAADMRLLNVHSRSRRNSPKNAAVRFAAHSSLLFEEPSGVVAIDPCVLAPGATFPPADPAAIFITHNHWDHLHAPTLVRYRRDVPVYIPTPTRETPHNPSISRFLQALGFTDVRFVRPGRPVRVGATTVTPLPFYGEWFGPGSSFDAFCYYVEHGGRTYLGTVDSDRDERGSMDPVIRRVAQDLPPIDTVFFGSSGQAHRPAFSCGSPWRWSNAFAKRYAVMMRYHPDVAVARRWLRLLRPALAVPYAEFVFGAPVSLRRWRDKFGGLGRSLKREGTKLLMLAPGEIVPAARQR